jgi:hypothetical protein
MRIAVSVITFGLLVSLLGCEAFVRKFTRKQKKDQIKKEELVLVPQEYKAPDLSKDELYRQYFLFWKSWQDELIESLSGSRVNQKKQVSCILEALKNLTQMEPLLKEDKQKRLKAYTHQLRELSSAIGDDIYGNNMVSNRQAAERILRNIAREFSYDKIKDSFQ